MIEIILDKSIIDDFGDISTPEGRLIEKIFLNEDNIFIINKSLLDYYEENVNSVFKQKWEDHFTYLSDNQRLVKSTNNTLDTNIIFSENPKRSDFIVIVKNLIESSEEKATCFLKDQSINNDLLKKLLLSNNITIRNSDFNSNQEIKSFFNKLFNCSKTIHRVRIISRYNNFNCDLINVLKTIFPKKTYWTTRKAQPDSSTNLKSLQTQLGNQLMLFTGNNDQIHERKFIIGGLIVEFDDDFNKITHDATTWICNCIVDNNLATTLLAKERLLTRQYH